jgi:hypothetical protein
MGTGAEFAVNPAKYKIKIHFLFLLTPHASTVFLLLI